MCVSFRERILYHPDEMLTILRGGSCRQTSRLPVYQTLGERMLWIICTVIQQLQKMKHQTTALPCILKQALCCNTHRHTHIYIMSQTLTTDCTKARHERLLSCTILCNRTEDCSVGQANRMPNVDIWVIRGDKPIGIHLNVNELPSWLLQDENERFIHLGWNRVQLHWIITHAMFLGVC